MQLRCVAFALALMACAEPPGPSGPAITSKIERKVLQIRARPSLDILFVIDSSPAMTPHLARLAENYPRYMQVLEAREGGLPNMHIGVVTADLGDPSAAGCTATGQDGLLQTTASVAGTFIRDRPILDGTRERNYSGSLADVFTELASRGDQGCTVQRPVAAAMRALSNPANAGFLRDDAYLAIVMISATDEPSDAANAHAQFFKDLKADPSKLFMTAVIGPSDPVDAACPAQPASRLHALLAQFPNRSDEASICAADSSDVLAELGYVPVHPIGGPCWQGSFADVDPDTTGLQLGCAAWVVGESYEATVPSCDTGRMPCYTFPEDPSCYGVSSHGTGVQLEPRSAYSAAPARLFVECLVE